MENSNEYVFSESLREEIARGIQQAKEGKTKSWDEVRNELEQKIRNKGNR